MMKHSFALLVAAATTALAGCQLYFGGEENDGSWNYCGEDGYYECSGDNCAWQGPDCPTSQPTGQPPGGFECTDSSDCAAGCYCQNGLCEEAGFCTQDSDCGMGYVCNEDRSSCEPGTPQPTTCNYDNECQTGEYCAPDHTCTATCVCADDETAIAGGYGWCDETRSTCLPGQDPAGSCGGEATCTTAQPNCPSGSVPTLIDGCWTGQCTDYAACDVAPSCSHINDSTNCLARSADCSPVYSGLNCTKPGGGACQEGDTDCTCTSFVFASCRDRTASPRTVTAADGTTIDASWLLLN